MASHQQCAYCMAGFGVLITIVIFMHIVTGDTLKLVALVGLAALTSAPNPATTICTNVVANWAGSWTETCKLKKNEQKTCLTS
jgi:hypothetical protein